MKAPLSTVRCVRSAAFRLKSRDKRAPSTRTKSLLSNIRASSFSQIENRTQPTVINGDIAFPWSERSCAFLRLRRLGGWRLVAQRPIVCCRARLKSSLSIRLSSYAVSAQFQDEAQRQSATSLEDDSCWAVSNENRFDCRSHIRLGNQRHGAAHKLQQAPCSGARRLLEIYEKTCASQIVATHGKPWKEH